MLPPDWRDALVEMVRGAAPLDGAWFGGGPTLSPEDQIHIYREQFWLRLGEAVTEDIPGLAQLLGEEVEETVRAFLLDQPPASWTLTAVTVGLADWLVARGAPAEQVEMARLDRAVAVGFLAAEGRPLDLAALSGATRLRLAPHVTLLRLGAPLHRLRAAAMLGEAIPERISGDFPLVIYRAEREMRHWEAPADAWMLLSAFGPGASVAEAIAAAQAAGVAEDVLAAGISGWFQAYGSRGLLEPVPSSFP